MTLSQLDWAFIIGFFILSIAIGVIVSKKSGSSAAEYFLSGRNMPWWLLGFSMVATTFSSDTPNLVTDIVRQNGVAGNWVWWAFLLTGMLTVFVYAKLWRRSGINTDLEFYELRYGGKAAAFLRGFRAIYLGVFFNVMIMATVSLAITKLGGVMLQLSPGQTLIILSTITVIYSVFGGFRGVVITDFFQFIIAIIGAFGAAYIAINLPQVGGLDALLSHSDVVGKLNILPDFNNTDAVVALLVLPLAVQWWSVWYPGAEPGGGGYIVQRMLSAKDEKHAMGATLFFNVAHYALRPWPWILVALASIIVFPDLASLQNAFPHLDPGIIGHDLAYPAMLTYLPSGLLGLVLASLIAAFMSTISTHLNWGSSYVVNDFYLRFINPKASDKKQVLVGRISTVVLMIFAAIVALQLQTAMQAFNILLQIGAGTGLLFILRWFWWRINPYSEVAAMVFSFLFALYVEMVHTQMLDFEPMSTTVKLLVGVGLTTLVWITVTYLTPADKEEVLERFYKLVQPGGPGWKKVIDSANKKGVKIVNAEHKWDVPQGILAMVAGSFAIYGTLFSTGYFIYGQYTLAVSTLVVALFNWWAVLKMWRKIKFN